MLSKFIRSENGRIVNKFLALCLVVTLTFANYIFLGTYLGKGIISYAKEEEENVEKLEVSQSFITNKVYKAGENFKRIVQIKLSSKIENAEGKAEFIIPQTVIENKTAKSAKVVSYETEFTNEDNKISFNAKEINEFILTYVYDEECEYNEETKVWTAKEEPNLKASAISITVEIDKDREIKANSEAIEYTKGIEFGEIIELNETISNLYKGNMYLNKDTEYSTKLNVEVKSLETGIFENSFIIGSNNRILGKKENEEDKLEEIENSIYYKSTVFSKKELLNMFNNEENNNGYIIVNALNKDESKDTIILFGNYDKEKYKNYTIINLKEATESDKIVIEHAEGTNKVNFLFTVPQKEGNLNIINNKSIKLSKDTNIERIQKLESTNALFDYNIQNIEKGNFVISINERKEIKEPSTKATLSMEYLNPNQTALSSLIDNEIKFTVNLLTSDVKYKLYENPVIEITLPDSVTIKSTNNIALALDDGLAIKNSSVKGNTITIELEEKQEDYNYDEVQQSISIGAIVSVNETASSGDIEITATCKNGEDDKINLETIKTKIFSPEELITLNTITVGDKVTNSMEEKNLMKIDTFQNKTTAIIDTTLINNHEESIEDVEIVGQIAAEGSTFSSALEKEITKSGIECSVKYFEGENETTDISKATSFAISIAEMKHGDTLKIQYELSLPKNLAYNESLFTTLNSKYKNEGKEVEKELTMQITTGKGPSAKVEIVPQTESSTLNGGQIITYNIKVTNDGDEDINEETILRYEIMENAKIIEYKTLQADIFEYLEDEDNKKEWKISKIEAGATKEVEVIIKVDNVKETAKLIGKVTVTKGEEVIALTDIEEKINVANFEVKMTTILNTNTVLEEKDKIEYRIQIENVSGKDINNATLTTFVPDNTSFVEGYIYIEEKEEKSTSCIKEENSNTVKYNIEKISKGETVIVKLVVEVNKLKAEANSEAEIQNYAVIEAEGANKCQSNKVTNIVRMPEFDIHLTSPNKATLKEYEEINYIITVKNTGKTSAVAEILDSVPDIISVNEIVYYTSEDEQFKTYINGSDLNFTNSVKVGETLTVILKGVVGSLKDDEETRTINNVAKLKLNNEEYLESEIVTNIIVQNEQAVQNNNNPQNNSNNNTEETATYAISGIVWLDENEDGRRETTEKTMKDIEVILINATTGEFVKNSNGEIIKTTTGEDGAYTFTKLANGNYKVIFKYDNAKYQTTTYKKEGINASVNSDATSQTITINEEAQTVALTDKIIIKDSSILNIDLGLKENNNFDLSLTKNIKKVTVKNNSGTTEYDFTNTNFAKVEIPGKYFKGSTLLIEYEITVANEGDVAANITDILDYMPKALNFNSEMNTNWYLDSEGSLHDIALSMDSLEPGKTVTEKLILTTTLDSDAATTITNIAEIGSADNAEGLAEHDSTPANKKDGEDDIGKAELIVSIKTGGALVYIGITLISLIIISGGIYFINKKILRGNI